MGLNKQDLLDSVSKYLKFKDEVILTLPEREDIIDDTIKEYSVVRPFQKVDKRTGTESAFYTLPVDYEDGFTEIFEIESPIGSSPKETIEEQHWAIELTENGKELHFDVFNPGISSEFLIKYTIRHTFESSGDSQIPVSDSVILSYLGASLMSSALASFFASKANPNLPEAEIVQFTDRVNEFNTMAEKWQEKYDKKVSEDSTGLHGQIDFSQDQYFDRNRE